LPKVEGGEMIGQAPCRRFGFAAGAQMDFRPGLNTETFFENASALKRAGLPG
jgi:hypothetical protein